MSIVQSKLRSLCFEIHPFHFKHLSANLFSFSHKYQNFRMCSLLVNRFSVVFQQIANYLAGFNGTWFCYSSDWYFQYLIMRFLANWHLLSSFDFSWTCKCQNLRPLTFISLARCLCYQYRFLCFKTLFPQNSLRLFFLFSPKSSPWLIVKISACSLCKHHKQISWEILKIFIVN
jgi:hypothetical protein